MNAAPGDAAPKITLQFVSGGGLSAELIEWFSHFPHSYSHVDTVLATGDLLGARSEHIGDVPAGVQIRPPGYATFTRRLVVELPATLEQAPRYTAFLLAQLGKPYDKIGIAAFAAERNWREAAAWFCDELVGAALEAAGWFPHAPLWPPNKWTPDDLVFLLSGLVDIGAAAHNADVAAAVAGRGAVTCAKCGQFISAARLIAVPDARLCGACNAELASEGA